MLSFSKKKRINSLGEIMAGFGLISSSGWA
jgi:hypothetical protein